jgi:hypothetical protein
MKHDAAAPRLAPVGGAQHGSRRGEPHVAMQITGHKTEAMYRRYNIMNGGHHGGDEETAAYRGALKRPIVGVP